MSFSASTGLPRQTPRMRRNQPGLTSHDPFSQHGGSYQGHDAPSNVLAGPSDSNGYTYGDEDVYPDELVGYRYERPEDPGRRMRIALDGVVEDLSDQEDRVYTAEANLRGTGEETLRPIGIMRTARETAQQRRSESPSDPGDRDLLQEDHLAVNGQDVNMQQQEEASGDLSMEAVEDLDADVEDRDDSGQTEGSLD